MNQARWGYVIILVAFIALSWGVRMVLSQRVSGRVFDEESSPEE